MDRLEGMKEGLHKARSGLIRALVKVEEGRITDIIISGDFILTPEHYIDEMEKSLLGVDADKDGILEALKKFYEDNGEEFKSPETYPEDFTEAIMKALGGE
ncbi:MAG: lipoate protein ligase C-terminal domain-containing protein [Candidatus Altiarchaeota archaeon]|nr:lipoate protein ligase C-terminal domain-containing protein [Candidatus Altiarchaeota archaeon]